MKKALSITLITLATPGIACYKTTTNRENPVVVVTPTPAMNATPEQVALALFEAARYTNWSRLPTLCMPDGSSERSAKAICDVGNVAGDERTAFREDFKQGGTDGIAAIDGDSAKINIKYAKKLAKTADLTLKRVDGKWYIVNFDEK